jgi:ATP-binding cassette subfamily F protein 3
VKAARPDERALRRELAALEKQVAKLEAERRRCHEALLVATDPAEALRLHEAVTRAAAELAAAEERWLAISEQLAAS